ncbi:MAG TPA: 1,2-phenylacetyl-CoA epoxidase subunit PaaC [Amycolatopsis sp.]|nr:1,2-phenylacetyl-CoA epoxidase subunit PaaC [Amycolatopsis sp.]
MMFDNAYEALADARDDSRWAFGTSPGGIGMSPGQRRDDPLSGMDTSVPAGMDGADLSSYCLMLGDDALVLSHRLQEWITHAPELEDEVAIANIALDLLGQARLLLARAGKADGSDRSEDSYAFFRPENEFRNVRLAELPRGDFGRLVALLLVFSTWRLALLQRLCDSADPVLAAIAAKGVKEVTYHRDYAARWAVRLGDGTDYSHERMQAGLDDVWPYVGELFTPHEIETRVGVNPVGARAEFDDVLAQVCAAAHLSLPGVPARAGVSGRMGRDGVHTEAMGFLLAELQSVARAYPEATW